MHNKTTLIGFNAGKIFQPEILSRGATSDRNQYAIVLLSSELGRTFKRDFDFVFARFGNPTDFGVKEDSVFEKHFEAFGQGANQITIGAHQQAVLKLNHADLGSKVGVNSSHFQTDIAAADHQ